MSAASCSAELRPCRTAGVRQSRGYDMNKLFLPVRKWLAFSEGATMAEYALMVMLIALACLTGVSLLGTNLRDFFNQIAASI